MELLTVAALRNGASPKLEIKFSKTYMGQAMKLLVSRIAFSQSFYCIVFKH
jgi:hypothetical protein